MSNIIARKDFAEQCGIANNAMPVYVVRGKIIMNGTRCSKCDGKKKPCKECSGREYIDLNYRSPDGHYINLDFYKKWAKKEPIPVKPKPLKENVIEQPKFIKPVVLGEKEKTIEYNDEVSEESSDDRLTRANKFKTYQNKEADRRLKEIEEAKLKGELIPINEVIEGFQFLGESQKRFYADAGENLIMIISERLNAQENDKAFMRTKLLDGINRAVDSAVDAAQERLKSKNDQEL